ncbi:ribonuclease E inhibitor RraB [Paenibacillus mucilaginosus]|uniref:ribonuclease E inhibitor RraB n=1 Tax=Paenibacillus mucilaginosus TaxID=61624 RepID=UPI001651A168|nr:ribonuclease E inhibitor RraB [Paenibacillus mucilaginosus]
MEGFQCNTSKDFEGKRWTTECSKEMMLEIDGISKEQHKINSIAQNYKGYVDGWGVLVRPNK